jgi:O-antigen/teichoic acid export membrane protein
MREKVAAVASPQASAASAASERSERPSLGAQTATILVAKTLAFALAFSVPPLLARWLGVEEFGLYRQLFLLVDTALAILPLGFYMSLLYFVPREPERASGVVLNVVLVSLVLGGGACLLLGLSPGLLATVLHTDRIGPYTPHLALIALLWATAPILETVMIARQEVRLASATVIGLQTTKAGLLLAAAWFSGSVGALVYAILIQGAVQAAVLLAYVCSRFGAFWRRFDPPLLRRQFLYWLPWGSATLLGISYGYLDKYFVSARFGPEAFAIYSVGCLSLPILGIVRESVGAVLIPRVCGLQKLGQHREIVATIATMLRSVAAIYFPLYALLLVTAPEVVTVLFTEEYRAAWPIFAVNLTWILLDYIFCACDPIIRAYPEHLGFVVGLRAGLLVTLFLALWLGTLVAGLVGAVAIAVTINLVDRAYIAFRLGRAIGIGKGDLGYLTDIGKLALASTAAGLVTAAVRAFFPSVPAFPLLMACSIILAVVYVLSLFVLRVPGVWGWVPGPAGRARSKEERPPVGSGPSAVPNHAPIRARERG